jgi:hypothetical protein
MYAPGAAADRRGTDRDRARGRLLRQGPRRRAGRSVLVLATPIFFAERQRVAELAITHRLPTMFQGRDYVEAGRPDELLRDVDRVRIDEVEVPYHLQLLDALDVGVRGELRFATFVDALRLPAPSARRSPAPAGRNWRARYRSERALAPTSMTNPPWRAPGPRPREPPETPHSKGPESTTRAAS